MPSPPLSLLLLLILQGPLPGQAVWGETRVTSEALSCMGTPKCWWQARQELLHQGKATGLAGVTLLEKGAASTSQVSQTALTAPR